MIDGRGRVALFAVSPDGKRFADRRQATVRIWNAGDGALVKEIAGSDQPIAALAFKGDGTQIALALGEQRRADLRRDDGDEVKKIEPLPAPITALAFRADGASSPSRARTTRSGSSTSPTARKSRRWTATGHDQRPGVRPERRQPARLGLGRQAGQALERQRGQGRPRLRRPRATPCSH